ncbi:MAG: COP23 domain-containing protein [Cyanobacteria bacterium J06641_2]
MKRNFILNIGIATLTTIVALYSNISPTFSQMIIGNLADTSTQQKTEDKESEAVKFMCKEIFDPASESNIPATVAWVPQRQGHVRLIAWKSQYFSSWSPQKRCNSVTNKFQKYYNEDRLNYLSTGKRNGYPVICAAKPGETCTKNNHLFTIKHGHNPKIVLQRLLGIFGGDSSTVLYQNSGKKLHVEMKNVFENAPLVEVEDSDNS